MKMRICVCLLLALCILFVACTAGQDAHIEYNGRLLTEEELKAMILAGMETEPTSTIVPIRFGNDEVETEFRVYWSEGGSVWHTDLGCGHISEKGDVYYGTVESALSQGKERPCATCEKKEND